jgi:hypothetical protein
MTVSKLIGAIFTGSRPEAAEEGENERRKHVRDTKLVDLAHEALVKKAASDRADLDGLVRYGWPHVQKEKFKTKVRKKVWDVVSGDIGSADSELVDEITDRIMDVSEVDEYYREMFDDKK